MEGSELSMSPCASCGSVADLAFSCQMCEAEMKKTNKDSVEVEK